MDNTPPRLVLIAAALLIVFGAFSLVEMGASLFRGTLKINFGFIGIPIGSGLLVGRQSSRSWAIGLSGIGLLLTLATVVWSLFRGSFTGATEEQLWLAGITVGLQIIVLATVFFGLRSADARAWFDAEDATRPQCSRWVMPLILIGVLFAVVSEVQTYAAEAKLRSFYPVRTRFTFRDSTTGAPLNSVGWSSDALTIRSGKSDLLAPRISRSVLNGPEGATLELNGLSGRPFDMSFTSDGFQPHVYTLDKETPSEVTISLHPSK